MPLANKPIEAYLGDGVYATWDGYMLSLDCRAQGPVDRICLEPEVFSALGDFLVQCNTQQTKQDDTRL